MDNSEYKDISYGASVILLGGAKQCGKSQSKKCVQTESSKL